MVRDSNKFVSFLSINFYVFGSKGKAEQVEDLSGTEKRRMDEKAIWLWVVKSGFIPTSKIKKTFHPGP